MSETKISSPVLSPGDPAPDFSLPDQDGKPVRLADLKGRNVVLYFYPTDDTPVCTVQACGIRDNYETLSSDGAVILGVSPDDQASHRAFRTKFSLPFTLLSDPEKRVISAYGVWGEKNMYGNIVTGVLRTTFVIDAEGRIKEIMRRVNTKVHAQKLIGILSAMS